MILSPSGCTLHPENVTYIIYVFGINFLKIYISVTICAQ